MRWDVEWLLPDGTKRSKTFKTLRAAKLFDGELRSAREEGETVDPRGGKTELRVVYKSWLSSHEICLRRCTAATRTTGGCKSSRSSATGRSGESCERTSRNGLTK
jgi:hypothetical protein